MKDGVFHELHMTVPESDIDRMGHVNNAAWVRWLEEAAWSHTHAVGLDWALYQRLNRSFVARRTEIEYLGAAFAGERLRVLTWVASNDGRISMIRRYRIEREQDARVLLRASTRWVCVTIDSGKPVRMPPEFLQAWPVAGDQEP